MNVGIEKLSLYGGRFFIDALELAQRGGRDPEQVSRQVMVSQRTVVPIWEDSVTLAVNAANQVLSDEDRQQIELVIVGTESGVDFSKSLATWVHRYCGLPANCFGFELKGACYAANAALRMAAQWVASGVRPGKKALVVSADFSHRARDVEVDMVGGGSAVAMLVSASPRILELDLGSRGYWMSEIADTFRPAARVEIAEGELSMYSYLDALDGAVEHYQQTTGEVDYLGAFKRHVYHAPFPGMTFQAHRAMLRRLGAATAAEIRQSFDERVKDGIHFARRVGTAFGASNFISLLGHLAVGASLSPGDLLSFFAYGSGCQGEFYSGRLGAAVAERSEFQQLAAALDERRRLTLEQYDAVEDRRDTLTDRADYVVQRDELSGEYDALYRGRRLLVLEEVKAHRRRYEFS